MVFVQGGAFDMGSEEEDAYGDERPVHRVRLDAFWIGRIPVTQGLWQAVLGENPARFTGNDRRPVESVSWEDIQHRFLPALNALTQVDGRSYRLPTEAEWEYAARGGPHHSPFRYAGSDKLKEVGWFGDNSHGETKPVGMKEPNALGLYDMSGNVWEWCYDEFDADYYEKCQYQGLEHNPIPPDEGRNRVLRGGDWILDPRGCRVAYRNQGWPDHRDGLAGFRLVGSLQLTGRAGWPPLNRRRSCPFPRKGRKAASRGPKR